ncbi:hypothetical protein ACLD02_02275 [Alloalcanivorax sp. C16-2]|uniref:hypothetical protein n=1 Tax=Alloalcanivorax TaxID=3020832 RepID=UPI0019326F74|nr:hypothetical protein [Alloalcanivorax marinus]MBL7250902.1 hypothetical protein [Alloalcanivorax marinus]
MGTQVKWAGPESSPRLAVDAVENRALALREYLVVYRAGVGPRRGRQQRLRELRYDIARLQAWGWYLRAGERRPLWWRFLHMLGGWFGAGRKERPGRRHQRRAGIQRLSAFSVVDRAYVAQIEDFQGRLLTLGLSHPPLSEELRRCSRVLEENVRHLSDERDRLTAEAGRIAVVCWLLGRLLRVRGWLGLNNSASRAMDP